MSERGKDLAENVVDVDARTLGRGGLVCEVSVVVVVKKVLKMGVVGVRVEGVGVVAMVVVGVGAPGHRGDQARLSSHLGRRGQYQREGSYPTLVEVA